AEGATLAFGGGVPKMQGFEGGCYVEPTIFTGVTDGMTIAQEEIFGPVLSTITFNDVEEAVAIANDTKYGLAAQLYTNNLHIAHKVSRAIRAGT
ncbi:aldehyde dehydrogenase family protein, partial [Mycobacterium tuberculosis]|nr:aldehyde dehydrogenase family protein [Mycobacterium tuberculosis]